MYRQLFELNPGSFKLKQKFSADDGAVRDEIELAHPRSPNKFECAIDVANAKLKEHVHEKFEEIGVARTAESLGSFDSIADDRVVGFGVGDEIFEFGHVELQVTVGKENPIFCRRVETRLNRAAVTSIDPMMNHFNPRIGFGQSIRDLGGLVAASIVNQNDFEIVGDFRHDGLGFPYALLDVFLFVVTGKEDRQ